MAKSDDSRANILDYVFQAARPSWDLAANLYVALHTSDPVSASSQLTGEATYTGYARVAVAVPAGFSRSGKRVTNTALIQFPICTGSSSTVTHFSVGVASTGAGRILYTGALDDPLSVTLNVVPQMAIGDLKIDEN